GCCVGQPGGKQPQRLVGCGELTSRSPTRVFNRCGVGTLLRCFPWPGLGPVKSVAFIVDGRGCAYAGGWLSPPHSQLPSGHAACPASWIRSFPRATNQTAPAPSPPRLLT